MRCREKLIVRKPYIKLDACINTLRKAMKDVGFSDDEIEDILNSEARTEFLGDYKCGFSMKIFGCSEEESIEECIREGGIVEIKEWCFEDGGYKFGIEVDCLGGKIYVFKCE